MRLKQLGLAAIAILIPLAACTTSPDGPPDDSQTFTYSFEDGDFEDWAIDATDVNDGGSVAMWSVTPSTDRATLGNGSLHFSVDNLTDAAKVWIERPFNGLVPATTYDVTSAFDLASRDFGDFNLWTVIAGGTTFNPEIASDLDNTYDGDTKAWNEDTGFRWLPISRTVQVTTDASGQLYVVAGVWGTWETLRDYYIDNLRVSLVQVSE